MDMSPSIPTAIWGFNGTERPGAVYLAAVLSAHAQKGIPAFGIYGEDVQDGGDTTIPNDVREKLLRFSRAGLAAATLKGRAYLSIGSVSMGIAGSIVNDTFFQEYLGMRNEYVDMSELTRRIEEEIYDPEEYKLALAWVKENCSEGPDNNPAHLQTDRKRKEYEWETVVKMTQIVRDLMAGNPKLAELGFTEESMGHHAIVSGFQGQRQWTDHSPNGDFLESILNSSFDWNGKRSPYLVATENDSLNGVSMLFGSLLTHTAQIFADVRTYWSSDSVKRVTGHQLEGNAKDGILHLINSGSAALDGTGQQSRAGEPVLKPFWEITDEEVQDCLKATSWRPASVEYFRGGGYSADFLTKGGMPVTMTRLNLVKGLGPVLQVAQGYTVDLPEDVHDTLDQRTDPTWPSTWFAPVLTGSGAFTSVYEVMNQWGANHGSISYGHIGADLLTLASMLRIPLIGRLGIPETLFPPLVQPGTVLGQLTDDLQTLDELELITGDIGFVPYVLPTTKLLADAVAAKVEEHTALILVNHGLVTTGKNLREAYYRTQVVEESAKVYMIAKAAGEPKVLTAEEYKEIQSLESEAYRVQLLQQLKS
ncbi:hypothetical protein G195_000235 [Phytophthora kernoviae 00238/432]|uniref:Class II aldolase/adducin N-terminal domain-containing protein n=1 Tax=Phytophthora kernoviae 00238/432 TaxID=1284355 RepID=A0A8J4WJX5_9STRA|nr:hypothetical protein G195_000235 [Phytophthora kernoviae 00238/432]